MGSPMTPAETAALALQTEEVNLSALRSLDDTKAGEEATPLDEIEDPFLIVSAYSTPTMWKGADGERAGFNVHMLCMLDPKQPTNLSEVYSNSDSVAAKINALLDEDGLSPAKPVLVKYQKAETRSGFRVHKLIAPTKAELETFRAALAASSPKSGK